MHTHKAVLGYVEIGPGIVALVTPFGVLADAAFFAGMALSVATTADSCANREVGSCVLGAASIAAGGAAFAAERMAANLATAARTAGFLRRPLLQGAAFIARRYRDLGNGMSLVTSGLTNLPCRALQWAAC